MYDTHSQFCWLYVNVCFPLQGILLACKVNWLDDPKLRDIAMTLEEFPISE